jgi:ubiquinone/menaquinone biosynthesis C-methylase UbiE
MSTPKTELDFEKLMLICQGHAAFQLLWAGTQLGVFDTISRTPGATLAKIAKEAALAPQPARILLTGLAALGLVENHDGSYHNHPLTEEHLLTASNDSMVPILGWQHHIVYKGLEDFVASLKENRNIGLRHFPGNEPALYPRLAHEPALEKVFQDAMESLSRQANRELTKVLDLSSSRCIMDVGGGKGENLIALAGRFPHLEGVVFDSESVCRLAEENIAEHGLSDRIKTHVGDLFDTPYPSGLDAIIYCHMFTIFSPEENRQILRKTGEALPEGGKAIIFNMMGSDADDGPMSTALGSCYFQAIATGKGMLYSWSDYEQWLTEAGFRKFERIENLPLDHGIFIATK